MIDKDIDDPHIGSIPECLDKANTKPRLYFNWNDWLPYLEEFDIPEDQRQAFIETLWMLVTSFIDLDVTVTDHKQTCGNQIDLKTLLERDMVSLDPIHPPPRLEESEAQHDPA